MNPDLHRGSPELLGSGDRPSNGSTTPPARAGRRGRRRQGLGTYWSSRRRIGRPLVAMLILGVPILGAGMSQTASSASSTAQAKALTPLQQGLQFYRGKTVTLISPGSVGVLYDQWARLVAPIMSSYLKATVNVEDVPQGQTLPGQDMAAGARPDGLTVGELNSFTDIINAVLHVPGLNFNPDRLVFLGGPGNAPIVLATLANSPYQNASSVLRANNAIHIVGNAGGVTGTFEHLVCAAWSLDCTYVTGYANGSAATLGFLRGDAPLTMTAITNILTAIPALVRPLLLTNANPYPASLAPYFRGLPTLQKLAKTAPKGKAAQAAMRALLTFAQVPSVIFIAPTKTPAVRVVALRAALERALTDPQVRAMALAEGNEPGYNTGAQLKQEYAVGVKSGSAVASVLD